MSLNLLQGIRKETEAPDFLDELQVVLLALCSAGLLATALSMLFNKEIQKI